MNQRGQLDQILTSVIVVVVIFFLMAVFVILASNLCILPSVECKRIADAAAQDYRIIEERAESRALLDLYLSDSIIFQGDVMSVREAIERISVVVRESEDDAYFLSVALEELFTAEYGCADSVLQIYDSECGAFDRGGCIRSFVNIPASRLSREGFLEPISLGSAEPDYYFPSEGDAVERNYAVMMLGDSEKPIWVIVQGRPACK